MGVRVYEVQPGDSPASIAARDEMAGCPKCAVDLVRANPHKEAVSHPNGFLSFKEFRAGEKIFLPDKWFDGSLDGRPKAYFAALAHYDGMTPSVLGLAASGILGNFQAIDIAAAQVGGLAMLGGKEFSDAVNGTGLIIENAIKEVDIDPAASVFAQRARSATDLARQLNASLASAIEAHDATAEAARRRDILESFSNALEDARRALSAFYDPPTPPTLTQPSSGPPPTFPASVVSAARAVVETATTSYCASVARSGTPFNQAVHAFKLAWNETQSPKVPINTGNYERETADALSRILGEAPAACPSRAVPGSPPPLVPLSASTPIASVAPPSKERGLSTGAMVGLGAIGVGVAGAAIYFSTKPKKKKRRRRR